MRALSVLALTSAEILSACAGPQATTAEHPRPDIEQRPDVAIVRVDGELFAEFHSGPGHKPMLHPLLAPGGAAVTRAPEPIDGEPQDHPHHTSQWFAHGDVDGRDFWHGENGAARIETSGLVVSGSAISSEHAWLADGERLLLERRTTTFGADATARWIDFDIALEPRPGGVTLGDTKEGTFALRLAESLRVEGPQAAGSLLDSERRADGAVWGQRARWVAARGPIDGAPVSVAIFEHPENLRHPTWWHARTYGLLAANPFGRHDFEGAAEGAGDLRLKGPLRLRYRIWLARGEATYDQIDVAWAEYVSSPE